MKIDFQIQTKRGVYSDALHLDDDHTFTAVQIEAMKQQRVDAWLAVLAAPPTAVPAEDLISEALPSEEV